MGKAARAALLLVEATSLPLLLLVYLYLLSGYQMLNPTIMLLPAAGRLHTDAVLRVLLTVLSYLHGAAGFIAIIERRVRSKALKAFLSYTVLAVMTAITALLLGLEAAVSAR